MEVPIDRLLRLPEVESFSGKKRSTIYKEIKQGKFPAPKRIGARSVAWRAGDLMDWLESRPVAGTLITENYTAARR